MYGFIFQIPIYPQTIATHDIMHLVFWQLFKAIYCALQMSI